jgi:acyl carrier protein
MSTAERSDQVLRRQLGPRVSWNADTSLMGQPGLALDSLDVVELVVGLEREFRLRIPDEAFWTEAGPRVGCVADLARYIDRRLAEQSQAA